MANTLKFGNGNWAIKEDSTLAYSDQYDNYKPLPFDFTRASNATVVNKEGLIETVGNGIPRIDFSDSSDGALLLEPQRTNYVTQSNNFTGWFKSGTITVTSNYGLSPTGENNSTLLSFSGANNRLYLNTGAAYTNDSVSIYVKGNNGETISFDKSASIGGAKLFTLTGGWDRLESSYDSLSSNRVNIVISTNAGATARIIEVFGVQNEQSSYPTSYIPTSGSAVTRVADACDNGGNEQVINSTEGVLYFEGSALADDGTNRVITLSKSSDWSNRTFLRYDASTNSITYRYLVNGSIKVNLVHTLSDATILNKIACKWELNNFKLYVNGLNVGQDLSGSVISANSLNKLNFNDGLGTNNFYGNTKDIRVYNTALTDQELAALTTI